MLTLKGLYMTVFSFMFKIRRTWKEAEKDNIRSAILLLLLIKKGEGKYIKRLIKKRYIGPPTLGQLS